MDISKLKQNPENPRTISEADLKRLVKSVESFQEMLKVRPIVVNTDLMILGGNMRYLACKELGIEKVPVHIVDWDEEKQKDFIIRDNLHFSAWDYELLADEWNKEDLKDWGVDIKIGDESEDFEPEFNPDIEDVEVTDKDIKEAEERVKKEPKKKEDNLLECECPECNKSFKFQI